MCGDTLHIFTFGIRARSEEHRVNLESENPERTWEGAPILDIFGGEE